MGKKRKADPELEAERSMYSSFVAAANAVSQLYTQGVQQQRRAAGAATKATLEKVVTFVLRENEGSETISKAALLQFLQHEYENADSSDASAPQPQMQFMPFPGTAAAAAAAAAAAGGGGDDTSDAHKAQRQASGGMIVSPAGRSASSSRLMCLEGQQQQQHLHQQQQQQQHFQAQQQQHQQHHQQQHPGLVHAGDPMQVHSSMMQMAGPFTGHMQQDVHPFMPPGGAGNGMH